MIMITGLGRCGTSFFAQLFKNLGWGVGYTLNFHDELRAGMELIPAYHISRDMFTDHICKNVNGVEEYTGEVPLDKKIHDDGYWKCDISFREKINRLDFDTPPERNEGHVEVIKDPRITWNPKIIRAWWEVRKDLKLIILHRKPEDVIKSREAIGIKEYGGPQHFWDPKRRKVLREFKEDFSDFMTEVLHWEIPYTLLFYPNFMYYEPSRIKDVIYRDLGVDVESKGRVFETVWNQLLDKDKISVF